MSQRSLSPEGMLLGGPNTSGYGGGLLSQGNGKGGSLLSGMLGGGVGGLGLLSSGTGRGKQPDLARSNSRPISGGAIDLRNNSTDNQQQKGLLNDGGFNPLPGTTANQCLGSKNAIFQIHVILIISLLL